jgi:hypothetical protein
MLVAALHAVTTDLDRRVAAAQARGARDARARLRALVIACLETAVSDRDLWAVFVEFWGEAMHDRRLREINAGLYARMRRLIARVVAEGTRTGVFRRVEPRLAASVILGLVDGVALQLTFDAAAFTVPAAARACDEALGRYLAPLPEADLRPGGRTSPDRRRP